jgi:hypothetical protein
MGIAKYLLLITLSVWLLAKLPVKRKRNCNGGRPIDWGVYLGLHLWTNTAGSYITFRLAQPAASFTAVGDEVKEKLFNFSPSIDGKAYWVDAQTIEFRPDEPMKSARFIHHRLNWETICSEGITVQEIRLQFSIIPQSIAIEFEGLMVESAENPNVYSLEGLVQTADAADMDKLKKCIEANYNGKDAEVVLEAAEAMNTYRLHIKGIERTRNKGSVEVKWDASEIDGNSKGAESFDVPESGSFVVISSKVTQSPQQSVLIVFSDLINSNQDFFGLVEIDGFSDLKFEVKKNMIRVYLPEAIQDVRTLKVNRGVQNAIGDKLKEEYSQTFAFEDVKPGIRSLGRGTILPTTQGLVYPFEAVNLKAVTVEIVKIYESNVPYYLQVNTLGGTYELKRVGYPIFKKVINLNQLGVITPNKWTRYTLDLSQLFNADPGAMYQISIRFNKKQLLKPCEGESADDATSSTMEFEEKINTSDYEGPGYYYDYEGDYYYDYDDDYNWRERDNPCNSAYYSDSKMIKQIIISSDLGVIAKLGNDGGMVVAVSDLPTAKAKSGVNVRVSDYQNQTIVEGSTDGDGLVELKTTRAPFLITVTDGKMKGYLRVDNGTSNSLSNFDVGGSEFSVV